MSEFNTRKNSGWITNCTRNSTRPEHWTAEESNHFLEASVPPLLKWRTSMIKKYKLEADFSIVVREVNLASSGDHDSHHGYYLVASIICYSHMTKEEIEAFNIAQEEKKKNVQG